MDDMELLVPAIRSNDVIFGTGHVLALPTDPLQWAIPGGTRTDDRQVALIVAENIDRLIRVAMRERL